MISTEDVVKSALTSTLVYPRVIVSTQTEKPLEFSAIAPLDSRNAASSPRLLEGVQDVEAQREAPTSLPEPVEDRVSLRIKLLFLVAWFWLNLCLTISNKAVMGRMRYPWLLTALHTSSTSMGCFVMLGFGSIKLTRLRPDENLTLIMFSSLFTLNIAISNVSLAMVSVPLHQTMRSICPVVTVVIYRTVYGRTFSTSTYLSLIPLILGVGLATAGDYSCTVIDFCLTLFGVILASVKSIATNQVMTGSLALSAMEFSLRMYPLAAIQSVVLGIMTGEAQQLRMLYKEGHVSETFCIALVANAMMAFLLNVVSLQANKLAGPLTMTVCGSVKQPISIFVGMMFFNVQTGWVNAVGMIITIAGAVWYSMVESDNKQARLQK